MLVKHKKKKHTEKTSDTHTKKHEKKAPKSEKKSSNSTWLWVGATVIVLIIALVVLNAKPTSEESPETTQTIKEVQQLALSAEDALKDVESEVDTSDLAEIQEEIDQLQDLISEKNKDTTAIGNQIEQVNKEIKAAGLESNQELSDVVSKLSAAKKKLSGGSTSTTSTTSEKVKLDFYVMSQCPYGTQVVDAIAPVLETIGDNVDFNLQFIANDNGDGTFRSLHGQPEVEGNIVQLCAIKYHPDDYMAMLTCQNKNAGAIPGNWEECASENSLEVELIRTCFEGEEGKELLRASITETQKVGATGSPTIYLNDEKYSGGRGENDFMRALCNAFENERPGACDDIPEPMKVNVIILNDKRCKECDTSQITSQLKGIFPGLVVKSYDYSDAEGKKLYDETGVKLLPAILFDEGVSEAENYANVERFLVPAGDYSSLRIGGAFDPSAEICDNEIDDTGNGKIDCDDETCIGTMTCRETIENHLQVFVMSDCPYGRKAIEALKEVVDNFGDKMDYEVHYIATEAGDGFTSLHGQYEVDENIIQLCVKEYSPAVWMDYIYCRSVNGVRDIDWNTCAEESGVVVDKIQTCFDGEEGKELLREDIKIANSLSISASPTWLANNKYQFSGITAEAVKTNFCKNNQDLEGCENTLTDDSGSVPAGGSC